LKTAEEFITTLNTYEQYWKISYIQHRDISIVAKGLYNSMKEKTPNIMNMIDIDNFCKVSIGKSEELIFDYQEEFIKIIVDTYPEAVI